ncbi:MAG: hypothetical protein L0G99_02600 [Propionibacteriales bacterium]|nr:hypothetical protein [Propionibacteriales bacterium]
MTDLTASDLEALRAGTIDDAGLGRLLSTELAEPELDAVRHALAEAPVLEMPVEVSARLAAVVNAESERRQSGRATAEQEAARARRAKQALGTFENSAPDKKAALRPRQHQNL